MKQLIVVEGIHDEMRLKALFKDAVILTTNGSEISKTTIELLKEYSKQDFEIILFLDPDSPGERIRSKIKEIIPNTKDAFIRKSLCISNNRKKVGVEHASDENLKKALESIYNPESIISIYSLNDMYYYGLLGDENSSYLRAYLGEALNIGRPNGKTLLKRLNEFQIPKLMLEELIKKYESRS